MTESILSKLSLKGMNSQPKKGTIKEGESRAIAHVFGAARRHELAQSSFGDSTRFVGDFEGINVETGETYKSTKMFMPDIFSDALVNALDAREDGDDSRIEFAVEIGVTYSEKGGTGYAYTVRPLIKTETRDSLAHLREAVLKALPAPEKDAEQKPKAGKAK